MQKKKLSELPLTEEALMTARFPGDISNAMEQLAEIGIKTTVGISRNCMHAVLRDRNAPSNIYGGAPPLVSLGDQAYKLTTHGIRRVLELVS